MSSAVMANGRRAHICPSTAPSWTSAMRGRWVGPLHTRCIRHLSGIFAMCSPHTAEFAIFVGKLHYYYYIEDPVAMFTNRA